MSSRSFYQTGSLGQVRRAERSMDPQVNQRSFGAASAVARAHSRASRTILVADDSDDGREMLRTLLELKGYRVLEARDGLEAISAGLSGDSDLILLDLQLPQRDGLEVTRHLREYSSQPDVPIIIISGHNSSTHGASALAAGCNEYLPKPIDFDLLENLLDKL